MREEIIGDCRLILGDCRDVLPTLPKIQACVTSPPYGEIRDYGGHGKPDLLAVISALAERLDDGGVIMWNTADQSINGSETGDSFRQALHAMECGLRLHDTMIYCKEGVTFPDAKRYHPCFEYMFVFSRGTPKHFNGIKDWPNKWRGTPPRGTKRMPTGETICAAVVGFANAENIAAEGLRRNWWPIGSGGLRDETAGHPAPMPFSMAHDHIETWTAPGDLVADPFMGSGTTGVAAIGLGRSFVGTEIYAKYFDIACRRIEAAHRHPRLFGT
jgi:hypothetical protein